MRWLQAAWAGALDRSLLLSRFVRNRRWRRDALYLGREWRDLLQRSRLDTLPTRTDARAKHILFATAVGGRSMATRLESLVGAALVARGAKVSVLLCDAALPACVQCTVRWYPDTEQFRKHGPRRDMCRNCCDPAAAVYSRLGFTVHRFGDYIRAEDRTAIAALVAQLPAAQLPSFRYANANVGEQALAGTLRFFARATLAGEPGAETVLRQFLSAAMLTAVAVDRLLAAERFDCVVADHGIYVPEGVVGDVCRSRATRVVHWQPAYRQRSFIFSHDDTYHRTLMQEPADAWEHLVLPRAAADALTDYLMSRRYGTKDWISFARAPDTEFDAAARSLGIDPDKPCIGLLTNVMWDAQVDYRSKAFPSMLAWLVRTVEYFRGRPDLQLMIRVHPAELYGVVRSRQLVVDELHAACSPLPSNVFVIGPESRLSTYTAMERCNAVLIYATTTGIELAAAGCPIIVAGEAWIRNKGISIDVTSAEEYERILQALPLPATRDAARRARARLYAYHFYFRRMIPLEAVQPSDTYGPFVLAVGDVSELAPGRSLGLDVICDGILDATPFVYPAERVRADAVTALPPARDTSLARTAPA